MKRFLAFFLTVVTVLFVLASCEKSPNNKPNKSETVNPEIGKVETNNSYLTPVKKELSEADRKTVDFYYREMVRLYPSFAKIPREMLMERIHRDDYLTVSFTFCFGGLPTDCECTFSTSPRYPDGNWRINEDEFKRYYQSGIDDTVMTEIRNYFSDEILKYINANKLDKTKFQKGSPHIYWQITDGQIYAGCEWIADITSFTTQKYGCGDHAHIFCRVLVDMTDDIHLTFYPAAGS